MVRHTFKIFCKPFNVCLTILRTLCVIELIFDPTPQPFPGIFFSWKLLLSKMNLGNFRLCCKLRNTFFCHKLDFHKFTGNKTNHKQNGSSRLEVFCKKGVLRNFPKFTGKHLYQWLFFNKVAGACDLLIKGLRHRCFPAWILGNF